MSSLVTSEYVQSLDNELLDAIGNGRFRFSGAYTSGVTPLPIPNSTVKL